MDDSDIIGRKFHEVNIDDLLTAVGTVTTRSFTQSTRDPHFHGRVPNIITELGTRGPQNFMTPV